MYIIDSKNYANKTDTYDTNSIAFWFKSMINMILFDFEYDFEIKFIHVFVFISDARVV